MARGRRKMGPSKGSKGMGLKKKKIKGFKIADTQFAERRINPRPGRQTGKR